MRRSARLLVWALLGTCGVSVLALSFVAVFAAAKAPDWSARAIGVLAVVGVLAGVVQATVAVGDQRRRRRAEMDRLSRSLEELDTHTAGMLEQSDASQQEAEKLVTDLIALRRDLATRVYPIPSRPIERPIERDDYPRPLSGKGGVGCFLRALVVLFVALFAAAALSYWIFFR